MDEAQVTQDVFCLLPFDRHTRRCAESWVKSRDSGQSRASSLLSPEGSLGLHCEDGEELYIRAVWHLGCKFVEVSWLIS